MLMVRFLLELSVISNNPSYFLEKLYDLIMRCQGDRIEEQRSALGDSNNPIEEDIKNIVLKMQAGRIEAQRADLKSPTSKASSETSSQTTAAQN